MNSTELAQKAERIQSVIEDHTLQAHGMLPMFVRSDDYQLPTAEDYRAMAPHRLLKGKTEAQVGLPPMHVWRAWENTSADTGSYLGAMSYRYRCTQDPATLAICRRTLGALRHIYDMGAEFDEPGFLTKPYGGRATNQTSGDQIQCVAVGLDAYRALACREDEAVIGEIFVGIADYQIRHDYWHKPGGFFAGVERPWDWTRGDWSYALIYAPVLYHAWLTTGDERYVAEIHRWYDACRSDDRWFGDKDAVSWGSPHRMLYLPSLMMEIDPFNHDKWRRFMAYVFSTVKTSVLPDGSAYSRVARDPESGEIAPVDPGWGGGPTRTGRVSVFGRACVNAQRWLPDEDMVGVARGILEGLDLDTFRFIMPARPGGELTLAWRPEGELIDHTSLTGWLWMYWEGRWRGYW